MAYAQGTKVVESALNAYDAGLKPFKPKEDGSKRPDAATWKSFRDKRLSREQVVTVFEGRKGIGIFTGRVFRETGHADVGIECFEFDDAAAYAAFMAKVEDITDLRALVERIRDGYEEHTPSGGFHWFFKCATVERNQKLAQRPKRDDEKQHENDNVKTLIETRGIGGWVVTAPSSGGVHKSGKPYVLRRGGFKQIVTITAAERQALFAFARSFDQMQQQRERSDRARGSTTSKGTRAGDDFNVRATWNDVLEPFGWRPTGGSGHIGYWPRPGATTDGHDATTNADGTDRLFVHSTSAAPFDINRYYTKFQAFALFNHDGDFKAAADALRSQGYGARNDEQAKQRAFTLYTLDEYRRWPVQPPLEPVMDLVGLGHGNARCPQALSDRCHGRRMGVCRPLPDADDRGGTPAPS